MAECTVKIMCDFDNKAPLEQIVEQVGKSEQTRSVISRHMPGGTWGQLFKPHVSHLYTSNKHATAFN